MPKVLEFVQEHPYAIAGVVAGGLVLYLLYSAGGSTTVVQGGPSDAQVQANTALQLAQYDLAGRANSAAAQLQAAQITANTELAEKNLDYQLGVYQTGKGADVSMAGIQAQEHIQLAGITSQQQIAGYAQETARDQIIATQNIALANAATYDALARYNAETTQASYAANVAIQQSHDNAAITTNAAQQKTAQKSSTNSLLGGIAGVIGGVLSFL